MKTSNKTTISAMGSSGKNHGNSAPKTQEKKSANPFNDDEDDFDLSLDDDLDSFDEMDIDDDDY